MITIVDDDESVRDSIKATYPSVEEFFRSDLDTSCPILDVQMKDLSGIELQERLIRGDRRTPTVFVTAIWNDRIRNQVIKGGGRILPADRAARLPHRLSTRVAYDRDND
jgi:FixJ family two-component response regulator